MDWTGWKLVDQFGWEQPQLSEVVGENERSKLSGVERPHDYQVGPFRCLGPSRVHVLRFPPV